MTTKQRQALPLCDKVEILRRVERGEKKSDVAAHYGIARSTLSTILKNKAVIQANARERPNADGCRIRKPAYDDLEKSLYKWFVDIRARNLPVSGPMLQQKARDLACILDITGFVAGSGWLQRFKDRYAITGKVVAGERQAVDTDNANKWIKDVWQEVAKKYEPSNIFNTDETALFWHMLPSRTLALKHEKCHGGKLNKARVTVLLTANMDGSSKLRPLVIGKFKSPMCLRGCTSLPVTYHSNSKAWMTRALFETWLRDWDDELALSGRKICLLLDNCSAHHCGISLRNIELCFLPPNATAVLQPLDQGIIRAFKLGYRKRVVERLLLKLRMNEELKINLLGAIQMISRACQDVTRDTIGNCFRHAGLCRVGAEAASDGSHSLSSGSPQPRCSAEPAAEDDGEFAALWEELSRVPDAAPQEVCSEDFVMVDDDVAVTASPLDAEIVADVVASADMEDEEPPPPEDDRPRPTFAEALSATDVLRRYCADIQGSGLELFDIISRVENVIHADVARRTVQTKITAYCK